MLRRKASEDVRLAGMGTTMTGAFFVGSDVFVLHVGDSKAYLLREGALRKITHDHTVAQQYADLGVIPQEDVPGHRMQHVLTRALGGPDEDLEGDMYHLMLRDGDRLLLCSDGLTDMANEAEIAGILAASADSDQACRALVDLALSRGGRDNITTIVASFLSSLIARHSGKIGCQARLSLPRSTLPRCVRGSASTKITSRGCL